MPIDDLWYLSRRGADGERLPSARHGRGKRWRVRYQDDSGADRAKMFERKADAEAWETRHRLGTLGLVQADRPPNSILFRDYAERWRLSRAAGWAVLTRTRVESNIRTQLNPAFGDWPIGTITLTDVLEWLTRCLAEGTPQSSTKLYFELLAAILNAAVIDKMISENPCNGVKLSKLLRSLSRAPKWVPNDDEVRRLFGEVPERYRGALWLGAGQGLRLGEALGFEAGPRCWEREAEELHVVQQLQYEPQQFDGGFYLTEPKSGSSGTVDLDPVVADHLGDHVSRFPPAEVEMVDVTSGTPLRRVVPLLFTTTRGHPFTDRTWSREWGKWRSRAGWPADHGTFHALRHYFAVTLIANGTDPKRVQWLLRHKTLQITLETYVRYWPRPERKRGIVGGVLGPLLRADK